MNYALEIHSSDNYFDLYTDRQTSINIDFLF